MIHRLRSSDKDEINELRKRLEKCKKEKEELRKNIALLPSFKFDLTERQKAIIEFLKKNPGKSKEDIIKNLESKGSQVTIRKEIKILEEQNIIICKKDKPNSQIYKIYVNKESILLDTYDNIYNFKKSFFETIDKVVNDQYWSDDYEENLYTNYSIMAGIILIYIHILNSYITYLTLEWSHKYVDNPSLLNKLYSLIFFNFVEMNLKLVTTFKMRFVKPISEKTNFTDFTDFHSPLTQGFVYNQFLLKPHIILNILKEYKNKNLHVHIFSLLDNAWKISFPIYKYTSMMGPQYNEIRNKPLKPIYQINEKLPLLLFHYLEEHGKDMKDQKFVFLRYTEEESISQLFDIPLEESDQEVYRPILADVLGPEKYKEIEKRYLVNRLIKFLEDIEILNSRKETFSKLKRKKPQNHEFNKRVLKFIQIEENYILEITKNEQISKMLKVAKDIRDSKLNESRTLINSISSEELKSFFNEIIRFSSIHKEVYSSLYDIDKEMGSTFEDTIEKIDASLYDIYKEVGSTFEDTINFKNKSNVKNDLNL